MNHANATAPSVTMGPQAAPNPSALDHDEPSQSGVRPLLGYLPARDLVDTLHALGCFRSLLQLLAAADLVEDLEDGGALTLFAPTDEAFAALGERVGALTHPDHAEELCDRLEYHLVRGRVDLDEAVAVGALRSLHGAEIHVREGDDGEVYVDGARVVGAPLSCQNGTLVILDRVLAPAPAQVITVNPASPLARTELHGVAHVERAREAEREEARRALLSLPAARPRAVDHSADTWTGLAALRGLPST